MVGQNINQRENESDLDETQVVIFNTGSGENYSVSAIIDDPLTIESSLKEVLEQGDFSDELDIKFDDGIIRKARIKRNNCSDIVIRNNKSQSIPGKMLKIKSAHTDCLIKFSDIRRIR